MAGEGGRLAKIHIFFLLEELLWIILKRNVIVA